MYPKKIKFRFTNPSNKLSIVPKNMQYVYTMGNSQISFYDIVAINKHYSCDGECTILSKDVKERITNMSPRRHFMVMYYIKMLDFPSSIPMLTVSGPLILVLINIL